MGYMGFGMRKEDYKRKPKGPSKKLKRYNESPPQDGSDAGHRASREYQEIRFRPIRERKWFKIMLLLTTLYFSWVVLDFLIIRDLVYKHEVRQFEKRGIAGFYLEHKPAIASLIDFTQRQNGKVTKIKSFLHFELTMLSEDYAAKRQDRSALAHHQSLNYFSMDMTFEIVDGNLKFGYPDSITTYKDYWSCNINVHDLAQIPPSFLTYLQTDSTEFEHILDSVYDLDLDIKTYQNGIVLSYTKFNKPYSIIVTDSIASLEELTDHQFEPIEENLYGVKARLFDLKLPEQSQSRTNTSLTKK